MHARLQALKRRFEGTVVATHLWWHLALFELARDEPRRALEVYGQRIRNGRSADVADLIDAAALLWRVQLRGGDTGVRWAELAAAWAPHIDDRFCSFSDVHAMLAFVGVHQTWLHAVERIRRPAQRRLTQPPAAAGPGLFERLRAAATAPAACRTGA